MSKDKDPFINITVAGGIGSGKATICNVIKKVLDENNIDNIVINEEDITDNILIKNVKSLKEKNLMVRIGTEQLPRLES